MQNKLDKDLWLNWDIKNTNMCPSCNKGNLQYKNKKIQSETSDSKHFARFSSGRCEHVVSFHLICTKCEEVVAVTGISLEDDEGKGFTPNHFYPALNIINIPIKCPKDIVKELKKSFSLFWVDENSCANSIRKSVEVLLDNLGIRRQIIRDNGKKPIRLELHKRIEELKSNEQYIPISQYLSAIKWGGNIGSHSSNLSKEKVLSLYEIINKVLIDLYGEEQKEKNRINMEVSAINTSKGNNLSRKFPLNE